MSNYGREYQHIEDLIIFDGSAGADCAYTALKSISEDFSILDYKWDGIASVFWGRHSDGSFGLYPKNQWRKGLKLSRTELIKEILTTNKSQGFAQRSELAGRYDTLWAILEKETPVGFSGFLNGDLLHCSVTPKLLTSITPNKVTYSSNIYTSALIAVHGIVHEFAAPVTNNIRRYTGILPQNSAVHLIPTTQPKGKIELTELQNLLELINNHRESIDYVSAYSVPKFTTLRQVLYKFATANAKSGVSIVDWLDSTSLSDFHKSHILAVVSTDAWSKFLAVFKLTKVISHSLLSHIYATQDSEIIATIRGQQGGEGFVCILPNGNLGKLINPEFRKLI